MLVTIITPSFNQGKYIEETILSVLNQTYKHIQYIIVDGGSVDDTMDIVNKYRDKIDIIIHEKDKGQSDAINKGFKLANGELVGWINSDDILYPNCIEQIVKLYNEHPDGSVYYNSPIDYIDESSRVIGKNANIIPDRKYLIEKNCIVLQQGSFYSTKLVREVGFADVDKYYCMDMDLWIRLLDKAPIYHSEYPSTAGFRMQLGSKTMLGAEKFQWANIKTLRSYGAPFYAKSIRENLKIVIKLKMKAILEPIGIWSYLKRLNS